METKLHASTSSRHACLQGCVHGHTPTRKHVHACIQADSASMHVSRSKRTAASAPTVLTSSQRCDIQPAEEDVKPLLQVNLAEQRRRRIISQSHRRVLRRGRRHHLDMACPAYCERRYLEIDLRRAARAYPCTLISFFLSSSSNLSSITPGECGGGGGEIPRRHPQRCSPTHAVLVTDAQQLAPNDSEHSSIKLQASAPEIGQNLVKVG